VSRPRVARACVCALLLSLAAGAILTGCRPAEAPDVPRASATSESTAAAVVTATHAPTEGPPLVGRVVLWHAWEPDETAGLEEVAAIFGARHPDVTLETVRVPAPDLRSEYEAAVGSGSGPTLLMGPAEWGPFLFDAERVMDLTDFAPPYLLESLIPAARTAVTYRGAVIGLPYRLEGVVLYRNTSIIPAPAETWDEFVSQARAATQGDVVGANLEQGFYFSAGHLMGLGGELMRTSGEPSFNSESGMEWVSLLLSFRDIGPTEYYTDNDASLFRLGLVGYVIDRSQWADTFAEALGRDNLAVDPWPAYGTGHLAGFVEAENLYLSADAEGADQAASLAFMAFVLSPEAQAILADREKAGHLPANSEVQIADRLQREMLIAFQQGFALPVDPEMVFYWSPMDAALLSILHDAVDPVVALTAAQEEILGSIARTRGGG
jgi:arabinogalactan oligomer/maltooligosaccharide transport system substrate-binding protein